jgi:hypothetical protein
MSFAIFLFFFKKKTKLAIHPFKKKQWIGPSTKAMMEGLSTRVELEGPCV